MQLAADRLTRPRSDHRFDQRGAGIGEADTHPGIDEGQHQALRATTISLLVAHARFSLCRFVRGIDAFDRIEVYQCAALPPMRQKLLVDAVFQAPVAQVLHRRTRGDRPHVAGAFRREERRVRRQ